MTELSVIDPEYQRCWLDERPCHNHCKAFDQDTEDCRILRVGEEVADTFMELVEFVGRATKEQPKKKRNKPRSRDGVDRSKERGPNIPKPRR